MKPTFQSSGQQILQNNTYLQNKVASPDILNKSKTSTFEEKTNKLSQIFAEQDALQKAMLARLGASSEEAQP